jgi:CheY-like chemotaxis protein
VIHRIFDPFFTTKEIGKGTGLGLSTAAGIVRSHGGFIVVDSEVGNGTAFKVYLPAAPDHAGEAPTEAVGKPARGKGETIMVVDDEEEIREMTRRLLEKNGYRVESAANGQEAIRVYMQNRERVKLVLTDLMMPVMGGAILARTLRILDSDLNVIATTGLEAAARQADAELPAGTIILPKPCTPQMLLEAVAGKVGSADRESTPRAGDSHSLPQDTAG